MEKPLILLISMQIISKKNTGNSAEIFVLEEKYVINFNVLNKQNLKEAKKCFSLLNPPPFTESTL